MKERERDRSGLEERTLPDLIKDTTEAAHALRVGQDDRGLLAFEAINRDLGVIAGGAARRGGVLPVFGDALKLLQEGTLLVARADLIALADLLEHRMARVLQQMAE